MSEKIKDGGPAFPAEYFDPAVFADLRATEGMHSAKALATGVSKGMSLRDWFAGQALAGFMANKDRPITFAHEDAAWCYTLADAMLVARKDGAE
ncbi:hypothetical protein GGQ64_005377 [Rhizobium azooxidifex]|uniref:Uncharacterized protein n=1 Tax=Mycoplana azooxidifex TaxID=1636188 RepID=A0A7W6DGE6_9HYPH|nr:hypothetical protein [Mycoplana azooxidifex]MBB3980130.1 hypothetical protein [Mycoplana azooxidifex]